MNKPDHITVPHYICPQCGRLGLRSIYADSCTACANVARIADPRAPARIPPPSGTLRWLELAVCVAIGVIIGLVLR